MPGNSLMYLAGDGDFRSDECEALLTEADIHSGCQSTLQPLPRVHKSAGASRKGLYYPWEHERFHIQGKEVLPLFRENKVWYGEAIRSGDRKFRVPDSYPLNAAGCGIDERGRRFIRVKACAGSLTWILAGGTSP